MSGSKDAINWKLSIYPPSGYRCSEAKDDGVEEGLFDDTGQQDSSLKTATSITRVQNGEKDGKTRKREFQPVGNRSFGGLLPSFDRRRSVRGLRRVSMLSLRWYYQQQVPRARSCMTPRKLCGNWRTCGGPAGSSMLRLPALGGHLIGRLEVTMERLDRSTAVTRRARCT
ncbi:hypothetical protein E4U16_006157 [Claviceps sp. LM84 group G4]|nr:hypothetical protein E4U33_000266 [Claviceps sp. LM78 group G4]KAG6085339.1 hypothetical protein E4U16_006157 [Claviceps sp. LM84 group G4]